MSDTRASAAPAGPAPAAASPATGTSTAVLLATAPAADGGCAALLPWEDGTLLGRLAGQLESLGLRDIHVLGRPAHEAELRATAGVTVHASPSIEHDFRTIARVAGGSDGGLVVLYGDMVTHRGALAGLIADPRVSTGILAGGRKRLLALRIRSRRGRVISAGSAYHVAYRPTAAFLGALKVAPQDRPALTATAERLAGLCADLPATWEDELARKCGSWRLALARAAAAGEDEAGVDDEDPAAVEADADVPTEIEDAEAVVLSDEDERRFATRLAAAREDAVALLLVGLVRSGEQVGASYLRKLFWARPLSRDDLQRAGEQIGEYDEDRVLLDSAVKSSDGFFTTFFVSPYSKYIARWSARRGLTPNQVTTISLFIGLLAALAFATGERWGLIAGAVLLQAAFTTDCVDGQLARYTRTFSKLGAWLDSIFDRSKEYLAFAGLAIGASRAGDPVWLLACCAITLQTVRHMSDFSFGGAQQQAIGATAQPPLEQPLDAAGAAAVARRSDRAAHKPPAAPTAAAQPDATAAPERPSRSPASRVLSLWHRFDRAPAVRWIKKMIAFPIGERFAVISLTAALFTPRVTFIALLAWGGLAFCYTQTGRVLRSIVR